MRVPLPAHLAPAAPFPRVTASELEREPSAPGIDRATYRLTTVAGPLRISLAIVDPRARGVRVDTVLANDVLGGAFETVSSIALRTGAVAAINGDYFAGGEPLGVVVRDGRLEHAASARAAFAIASDGSVVIAPNGDALPAACSDSRLPRTARSYARRCIRTAIGGGPVLLRDGLPIEAGEPFGRLATNRATRIPVSAVATLAHGTFALIAIDGRHPATSIGVRRVDLVALLRALGAHDAMLLDGGGSTAFAARVLGEDRATIVNSPSDGVERPVADALVVTSHVPLGEPDRLIVRPARITALPGVRVALTARVVDAAGHAFGAARGRWRLTSAPHGATLGEDGVLRVGAAHGSFVVRVMRGELAARVPLRVIDRVARLTIGPDHANPSPGQLFALTLDGYDARGNRVAVNGRERWSARGARIDARGRLIVGATDALVTAHAPGASVEARIPVGQHDVAVPLLPPLVWSFLTYPPGGGGGLRAAGDGLHVRYDFSGHQLAAYARATPPYSLGVPVGLACDVEGDAQGAALRATFVDRFDAREDVTLSPAIDFTGRRRLTATIAPVLSAPVALEQIYVVGILSQQRLRSRGDIGIANCTATIAGAAPAAAARPN